MIGRVQLSHEIPKTLFSFGDKINDYPYALGHLLNKDKVYTAYYREQLARHAYSILDNSIFELGHSISFEELYELGKEFNPYILVLPDVLGDAEQTIYNASEYSRKYPRVINNMWSTHMGVTQGKTFEEIANCIDYYYYGLGLRIVALPYDLVPDADRVTVRYRFFKWWLKSKFYNPRFETSLKFHLLGCESPAEFTLYHGSPEITKFFKSIDTSSPIVNGWEGNAIGVHGYIPQKPKAKIAENLDISLSPEQITLILENVSRFKVLTRF